MATKKIEGRMEAIEEQIVGIHGEMAAVKEDLQGLGPLENKVDYMLEKLSLLERLEKIMHRWEDSGKVMSSELKKEKGISREGFSSGVRVLPGEERSSRNKSSLE